MKRVRILVVDDSVLFRSQIQLALKDCPEIEVVGTASNGKIAIEKATNLDVDLMVLDLEMPVMDGIETIKALKENKSRTKIILFSSMSRSGAEKTLEGMKLGALDFVAKPVPDDSGLSPDAKIKGSLLPKILSLFSLPVPKAAAPVVRVTEIKTRILWEAFRPEVLVIASSTGGPNALYELFEMLKDPVPFPILIAQHMPPVFTASLAQKLGEISGKVAGEGLQAQTLKPNCIYVAPGNFHMSLHGTRMQASIQLDQRAPRNYVRPCADYLLETAAGIFGSRTLGVILTGMGRDGADGARAIKSASGAVMIQDQASSVVFGMPGAVHEAGDYDFMSTPTDIGNKLAALARARTGFNVA